MARYTGLLLILVCDTRWASGFVPGVASWSTRAAQRLNRREATPLAPRVAYARSGQDCRGLAARAIPSTPAAFAHTCEGSRPRSRNSEGRRNRSVRMMSSLAGGRSGRSKTEEGSGAPPSSSAGLAPQVSSDLPVGDMADDPTLAEVLTTCRAADERKAENVVALRVAQLTAMTEYMVILEGNSRPQNQAIAQNIEEKMMEHHNREPKHQGSPESGWILLDFGDIIVHVMTPKSRRYYDLDSFWGNGTPVPLEGVLTPNAPPSVEPVAEEVDPFWS